MKQKTNRAGWLLPTNVMVMIAASLFCAILVSVFPQNSVQVFAAEEISAAQSIPAVDAVHGIACTAKETPDSVIYADGTSLQLPVHSGMTATVNADGATSTVELYSGTVRDALAKAGITLSATDECVPSPDVLLTDGLNISVSRVSVSEIVTTESVSYSTVRENDNTMVKGTTKVAQPGVNGVRTIVTRRTVVDGVITDETVVSNSITTEPVSQIIKVGTKVVYGTYHDMRVSVSTQVTALDLHTQASQIGTSDRPGSASWRATIHDDGTITDQFGNTVSYQSMISGRSTAYYAAAGAGTSTGRLASYGVVAVDPKVIPYGTRMFICSADGSIVYGYAIAGDTGGTLLKGTVLVDLYYNSYGQCCWFGSRKMNVYILK